MNETKGYIMGIDNLYPVEAESEEEAREKFLEQIKEGRLGFSLDDLEPKVVDVDPSYYDD